MRILVALAVTLFFGGLVVEHRIDRDWADSLGVTMQELGFIAGFLALWAWAL